MIPEPGPHADPPEDLRGRGDRWGPWASFSLLGVVAWLDTLMAAYLLQGTFRALPAGGGPGALLVLVPAAVLLACAAASFAVSGPFLRTAHPRLLMA